MGDSMSNKKKIIIIIAAVILTAAITITALIILKPFDKPVPVKVVNKESADALKKQAIEAMKTKDSATAKPLLEEAQKQYQSVNDTDNVVDTAAQLWILEHPIVPTEK